MTIVSTRDFRSNQTKYLGMANRGERVILRSRMGSFHLTPVEEDSKTISQQQYVKESLSRAFDELHSAQREGRKLKSADDFIKELQNTETV